MSGDGPAASVTREEGTVRKEYRFESPALAATVAPAVRSYHADLLEAGLSVPRLHGVAVDGATVTVAQEYVDGVVPARAVDRAARSDRFDDGEVVALCADSFHGLCRVLRTVDVVGEPAEDLTEGVRFAAGYDWKPANLVRRDGVYYAFDLVYPLSLSPESGLVDTDLRERNGDPFPPVLAYYLRYTPVGAVQNLGLATLAAVGDRVGADAADALRSRLVDVAEEVLGEFGFSRDWGPLFAPAGPGRTYEDVVSLYRRTGALRVADVLAERAPAPGDRG